ncbi:MAG: adenylate/guanylate cyclase domain-containing protein [Chloroherpetonaceae bacterium]|nr:adenylate/guanylate cyclase domain-containing protein [Chloroherpetonaceae bacterium]
MKEKDKETSALATSEQRKLSAIMFTDMVGYSALTQKNEKLALKLLEEHRRILRPLFQKHHGIEIKTIGDAFLVSFNNTLNAVSCALEIQKTLIEYNAASPETVQIKVRIGIHLGDVVHRSGDVYGDGVNIAARIHTIADPNGIAISEDVCRQVVNKINARFIKLGKGDLKNIAMGIAIYKVEPHTESYFRTFLAQLKFYARQRRTQYLALAVAGILLLAFAFSQSLHGKGDRPELLAVVTDFVNETGEGRLEKQLGTLLRSVLDDSPDLEVMTEAKMQSEAKKLGKDKPKRIDEELAMEIASSTKV